MKNKILKTSLLILFTMKSLLAQDIRLTPDMFEYSENSINGVYLCTPQHVEDGDCRAVDDEYYTNLALISMGSYDIGLLTVNGIKTIAFKGPLSPGSGDILVKILKKHPEVKTLVLSSTGGMQEDAFKIIDYIKNKDYTTWVPAKRACLSACSSIFLSGTTRILEGQLGLHTGIYKLRHISQVRDMEVAQDTVNEALFQNNTYLLKKIEIYTNLGLPFSKVSRLMETIVDAKGEFLVFHSMEELTSFDPSNEYIKTMDEIGATVKTQELINFEFNNYEPLI